jgi:oxygen-independent coproporphyrinogen-3 oxidase
VLPELLRRFTSRLLTGRPGFVFDNRVPPIHELAERFDAIDELGIYLHIPFCRQICHYCPYNKERYSREAAASYAAAVIREIDRYAGIIGARPVTSLYIGGGTPTTMLNDGLPRILGHLREVLDIRCGVHMESHLNDLTDEHLDAIQSLGVEHLSMGVEALDEKSLRFLRRPYTPEAARAAVERAVARGFECVNVDLMFTLPGQSREELERAARDLIELGVQQVATYPLFRFDYTRLGSGGRVDNHGLRLILGRWRMLKALQRVFYDAGYERTSVWAFTRRGVPRYCSVTVPLYLGLGAGAGSYLRDIFYLNTFRVADYVDAVERCGSAVALSMDLTDRMQMAGWLYWRIYETRWDKAAFLERFGRRFDAVYGNYFRLLRLMGFARDDGERITLTDRGAYWLHALEDALSIDYIGKVWGAAREEPWPATVPL